MRTIIDVIKEKTVEVGNCLEWTGYCCRGTPKTSVGGKGIAVRKLIAQRSGMNTDGKLVTNKCNNSRCVKPEHLVLMTKKDFHSHISKNKIDQKALSRRSKLSMAARSRAKLTPEIAAEIRASTETQEQIAKRFGICKRTVGSIQHGITWRDYGMFSQLWRV